LEVSKFTSLDLSQTSHIQMIDLVEMNLGTFKELDGNTLERYVWVHIGIVDILQVVSEKIGFKESKFKQ
jgi:hypothetical protein